MRLLDRPVDFGSMLKMSYADYTRIASINADLQQTRRAYKLGKRKAATGREPTSEKKLRVESIQKALSCVCNENHNCIAAFSQEDVTAIRR